MYTHKNSNTIINIRSKEEKDSLFLLTILVWMEEVRWGARDGWGRNLFDLVFLLFLDPFECHILYNDQYNYWWAILQASISRLLLSALGDGINVSSLLIKLLRVIMIHRHSHLHMITIHKKSQQKNHLQLSFQSPRVENGIK